MEQKKLTKLTLTAAIIAVLGVFLGSYIWVPIGTKKDETEMRYSGTFNGNGHHVKVCCVDATHCYHISAQRN